MYSGITSGRVLNLTSRIFVHIYMYIYTNLQKLIYLHLLTDCFMKISLQSSEQIYRYPYYIALV